MRAFLMSLAVAAPALMLGIAAGILFGFNDALITTVTKTLDNGVIQAVIDKASGKVTSYKLNGTQMVDPANPIYYSMDGGAAFEVPTNLVYSVTTQTADMVDVSFKRTWNDTSGYKHAFDIDLHFVLRRGDTGTAVRASSAVPGVFVPVPIAGREYVDGGLVAPVPVRQARQMGAELVIAVDISSAPEGNATNDTFRLLLQTFAIMGQSINRLELAGAELVVRPSLAGVGSADFASRQRSIEAGRAAMTAALPRLKALLERRAP